MPAGPLAMHAKLSNSSKTPATTAPCTQPGGPWYGQVKRAVDDIRETLKKNARIERYVGDSLAAQVEKVYIEMGGKPFLAKEAALDEHQNHARAHGAGGGGYQSINQQTSNQ